MQSASHCAVEEVEYSSCGNSDHAPGGTLEGAEDGAEIKGHEDGNATAHEVHGRDCVGYVSFYVRHFCLVAGGLPR